MNTAGQLVYLPLPRRLIFRNSRNFCLLTLCLECVELDSFVKVEKKKIELGWVEGIPCWGI